LHDVFDENLSISKFCKEFEDCEMTDDFPERAIEFLSSHFFEIDSSFLNGLPISILIRILSNSSLKVETEDSLYQMFHSQNESNIHSGEGFLFVRFELLSIESIQDFISWSCDNCQSFQQLLSLNVWIAICGRLCLSVDVECPIQRYCVKCLHFIPESASPLVGIISYLTSQHGGFSIAELSMFLRVRLMVHILPRMPLIYSQLLFSSLRMSRINGCVMNPVITGCVHGFLKDRWMAHHGQSWMVGTNDESTNSNHPIGTFPVSNHFAFRYLRLRQAGVDAGGSSFLQWKSSEI
jgi:hypothetical protein